MKQIEGRARFRQKYSRMFFWYVPLISVIGFLLMMPTIDWDWLTGIAFLIPGIGIGGVLGVLLRDVP